MKNISVIRTIDYRVGEFITLGALRTIVEETIDKNADSIVSVEVEPGQRDAEYYHLIIQERE